ncbi:MAG: 5-oxoprolinase subunit PxpB [Pseudomonadota bacterium]
MRTLSDNPIFLPLGEAALLVQFGESVDRAISERVVALDAVVNDADIAGLVETAPSFRSLMVQFDPLMTHSDAVRDQIAQLIANVNSATLSNRSFVLPACYEPEFGPDQVDVAEQTGLSVDEVIAIHSEQTFHVYMIGFLPGHPYLGNLPDSLNLPRRANPRVTVPKGSVATAVGLSVIYPVESPGGWNLLARTPVPLFSTNGAEPALLAPGDKVKFQPVPRTEFEKIAAAVGAGEWIAEREALQ